MIIKEISSFGSWFFRQACGAGSLLSKGSPVCKLDRREHSQGDGEAVRWCMGVEPQISMAVALLRLCRQSTGENLATYFDHGRRQGAGRSTCHLKWLRLQRKTARIRICSSMDVRSLMFNDLPNDLHFRKFLPMIYGSLGLIGGTIYHFSWYIFQLISPWSNNLAWSIINHPLSTIRSHH